MASRLAFPSLTSLYKNGTISAKDVVASSSSLADKIYLLTSDITKLEIDAIVNAANSTLLGGGGVDGAIHRAAGKELLAECRTLKGCSTGEAKITDAYELPCRKVIHTVGPNMHFETSLEEAAKKLSNCYKHSLDLAVENGCRTIAFPCISTGVYAFPAKRAAITASETVKTFLEGSNGSHIDAVIFCCFSTQDENIYQKTLP
jgi:O-acetyl-ADP-ribose deacetylase (regulator of RNase III)